MTANEPFGASHRHIPELDGLRGIAILLVLMVHFGDYSPTHDFAIAQIYRGIIGSGWIGVDLFFVLSGCLITGVLLDAKGSPNYFRSFYMRRALRILPLYYAMCAGYFLLYLPVVHSLHGDRGAVEPQQLWFWFYLSNWKLAFNSHFAPPLGHFWTLAIEEQFYLVWPLLVFSIRERTLARTCLVLAAVALLLRSLPPFQAEQGKYPEFLYSLTPFRLDALAIGAWAAVTLRDPRRRQVLKKWLSAVFGLGAIAFAAAIVLGGNVRYFSGPMTSFGYTAVALLCVCLVSYAVLCSGQNTWAARALRAPLLVRLGKYSYGIYVLHWPLSGYLDDFLQDHVDAAGGLLAAGMSLVIGPLSSYGLGVLSWNVLEKHFLRLKSRFPYRQTV